MKGRPVLMYTVEAFHQYLPEMPLILVLPKKHMKTWKQLCDQYHFSLPFTLCEGGSTRFKSVKNGLDAIQGEGLVAIHDGVRPLIDSETIGRSFNAASRYQSGVTTIPMKNSIREVLPGGSRSLNRNNYLMVQTPQTFDLALIKQAYDRVEQDSFTDDASVWEAAGHQVNLVDGSEKNLKITTIHDLMMAEILMNL